MSTFLIGSLASSPIFAGDFFQKLFPNNLGQQNEIRQKANVTTQIAKSRVLNFSGQWIGSCSYLGFQFPVDITLANTDEYLRIDGVEYEIGKLDSRTSSGRYQNVMSHSTVEWNKDMTSLMLKSVMLLRGHNDYPYNNPTPFDLGVNSAEISMDKDTLIVQGHTMKLPNLEKKDDPVEFNCSFTKNKAVASGA
jgi:hypothetical protein